MSFFSVGINGLILLCLTAPDTASNAPGFRYFCIAVLMSFIKLTHFNYSF